MYIRYLTTAITEALHTVFDEEYPNEQFRNVWVSVEYPIKPQNFPGIWLSYEDSQPLRHAGIGHIEGLETGYPYTRWRYQGHVTFTVVAFTSLQRDELYDELIGTIAFGAQTIVQSQFRQTIEHNDFIGINFDFDTVEPAGASAAPGTPWGSDEVIYERSCAMQAIGEFVPDPEHHELVNLREIIITADAEAPLGSGRVGGFTTIIDHNSDGTQFIGG